MEPVGNRNIPVVQQDGICGGIALKLLNDTHRYGRFPFVPPAITTTDIKNLILQNPTNLIHVVDDVPPLIMVNRFLQQKSDGVLVLNSNKGEGHVVAFIVNDEGDLIFYEPNAKTERIDMFRLKPDATPQEFLQDFATYFPTYAIAQIILIRKNIAPPPTPEREGGRRTRRRKRKTRKVKRRTKQ
jgi:hypothetical protein